eukprot:TRINITY_DN1347_c0_g1_i4.p5 TRINITY_DN1347_c0_g1~~TRINITY_DN1347_c0_g1_i4.p5  ORF type:complete len:102 (-),score=35.84 TRINITY_DN1347_c0_g1_i4:78-383(-)
MEYDTSDTKCKLSPTLVQAGTTTCQSGVLDYYRFGCNEAGVFGEYSCSSADCTTGCSFAGTEDANVCELGSSYNARYKCYGAASALAPIAALLLAALALVL